MSLTAFVGRERELDEFRSRRDEQDAQASWLAPLSAVCHSAGIISDTEPSAATPDFDVLTLADGVFSELARQELSPGELRVLRYLPTNLSRPEIVGVLSVSVNTVSTHLRTI